MRAPLLLPPQKNKQNWLLKKNCWIILSLSFSLCSLSFHFCRWVWIIEMVRKFFSFQFVFIFSCRKDEENVPKVYFMTEWDWKIVCVCVSHESVWDAKEKKEKPFCWVVEKKLCDWKTKMFASSWNGKETSKMKKKVNNNSRSNGN